MMLERSERLDMRLAELYGAWQIARNGNDRARAARRLRLVEWLLDELEDHDRPLCDCSSCVNRRDAEASHAG